MHDDGFAAPRLIALGDLDLARKDDRQAVADLAHPDQHLARAIGTGHAKAAQALDLRRRQGGKHLMAPRLDNRRGWLRHPSPLKETPFDQRHSQCPLMCVNTLWPDPLMLGPVTEMPDGRNDQAENIVAAQ